MDSAPLLGKRVELRGLLPRDFDYVYSLWSAAEIAFRTRERGAVSTPDRAQQTLSQGVLLQLIIAQRSNRAPAGLITAYHPVRFLRVHIALTMDERMRRKAWPLESVPLFVNFLFSNWPFTKICMDCPGYHADEYLRGALRLFAEEGRLRDHEFYRGRYWDLHLLALTRDRWEEVRERYLHAIAAGPRDRVEEVSHQEQAS